MLKRLGIALELFVLLVCAGTIVWATCHESSDCEDLETDLIGPWQWGIWTVNYHINEDLYSGGEDRPVLTPDVKKGTAKWSNIEFEGETLHFKFKYAGTTDAHPDVIDGINTIAYGPLDSGTVARAYVTPKGDGSSYIKECDMRFNYYKKWSLHKTNFPSGRYCVFNVACHEFGHWVGLLDVTATQCSDYSPYTMYKYATAEDHTRISLECEDKWGAWYLYAGG